MTNQQPNTHVEAQPPNFTAVLSAASTEGVPESKAGMPVFEKIGTFVGDGETVPPLSACDFRPRFIMYKDQVTNEWVIQK